MWMVGQFQWTYYEVVSPPGCARAVCWRHYFLPAREFPIIAALALRPHRKRGELHLRLGYLDFGLLLTWWTFLYVYVVLPWMYATPTLEIYNTNYNTLTYLQHFLITIGFGICWLRSTGAWRTVYFHLFAPTALYMLDSLATNMAIARNALLHGQLV